MLAWLFCMVQGADLPLAQLMPLSLTVSCSSKSRLDWFYRPEEGQPRQFITGELQADIELVDCIQGTGATRFGMTLTSPAQLCQLQPVPVGVQDWSLNGDCTAGSSQWHLHSGG